MTIAKLRALVERLEEQLHLTQQQLRATAETYETEAEEFRATIDELQTKNAQISTLNNSLKEYVEEIGRANEERLQASEEKYRTLFNTMAEGFAFCRVVRDEDGRVVDLTYLELNEAVERVTGVDHRLFIGRRLSELFTKGDVDRLMPIHAHVANTGESVTVENYAEFTDRWYELSLYRSGEDELSIFFRDISERKQRERQREYLLKLSDALRPIVEAEEIEITACSVLGEWLGAHRVYYVEIFEKDGIGRVRRQYLRGGAPSIAGDYPLTAYNWTMHPLRRGEAVVVSDVYHSDLVSSEYIAPMEAVQQISIILVPLIKEGKCVGVLTVGDDAPRNWKEEDVELARETLERMWAAAERARVEEALRESEVKYRTLFNSIDEGFAIEELVYGDDGEIEDIIFREVNRAYERQSGLTKVVAGKSIKEVLPNMEQHWKDAFAQLVKTREPMRMVNYAQDVDRWFDVYLTMIAGSDKHMAVVFNDITERKRREEHQEFILKLSDTLRPLSDPVAVKDTAMQILGEHLGVNRASYGDVLDDENTIVFSPGYANNVSSLPPQMKFSDFYPEMMNAYRAGQTIVLNDVQGDAKITAIAKEVFDAILVRAAVGVPLVKNGKVRAIMSIHQSALRQWTQAEIALLEESAERIWSAVERVRAEEGLRESEGRLRALVENLPGGAVFVVDRDLRYLVAEGEALAAAGFKPADLIGRTIQEAMPPELVSSYTSLYTRGLAGEPFEHEHEAHDRSFISRGVPLVSANGEVYAVLAISYDITERKRAEERLRASEERLRLLIESVEDYAIFTMDTMGRINSWNPGAERTFGYTEEEAIGEHTEIIFTPEDRDQGVPEEEIRQARRANRAADERWHISKPGTRFYVSGVMVPLRDDKGKITGYAKIARDLTERREMEEALRRAHDVLEERVKERTRELGEANTALKEEVRERSAAERRIKHLLRQVMTVQEEERRRIARELHDMLGQQLTALHWSIDRLKSKTVEVPGVREETERMSSIFERLNADVDFLAWELRPAALDTLGLDAALQSFVHEWSEHFKIAADYRGPVSGATRLAPESESNLYRILQEALQNVHKHAGATHVSVILEQHDGRALLIVEDNGCGYNPDTEVAMDTNKGMGVINMRERTALIGGELEIESSPGTGTTIFVRVPVNPTRKSKGAPKERH